MYFSLIFLMHICTNQNSGLFTKKTLFYVQSKAEQLCKISVTFIKNYFFGGESNKTLMLDLD